MNLFGKGCAKQQEVKATHDPIQSTIEDIQSLFNKDGPAVSYSSDHDTYLNMLQNAPFYVSGIHCRDGDITWWAAAVDEDAYNKWEGHVEHQHHPQEEYEHYMCITPREEAIA